MASIRLGGFAAAIQPYCLINTIGDLKRFIDQAIARGAKHNNLLFIQIAANLGYDEHHPAIAGVEMGAKPYMVIIPDFEHLQETPG